MRVLRTINKLPIIGAVMALVALVFSACATVEDEELGMIPPSANYSPIQAPVYPPLNQPYSPNLLNGDDSRVMNIDRLNVGEANIAGALMPGANPPNMDLARSGNAQNGNAMGGENNNSYPQNANGANGYNPNGEPYTSDYAQEYVPSYIAPSEVVPYEQVMPNGQEMANIEPQQLSPVPQIHIPQIVPFSPLPEQPKSPEMPPMQPQMQPEQTPPPPPIVEQTLEPQPEPKVPNIIPNSPVLEREQVLELSAVGMGVAPESTISPSQALALAKRAAIIDAYRQIGEKMYGIKINAQDTVKDMVMTNSVVKARVEALIKNADIVETIYKDGLCQVTMELKLDSRTWNRILATNG